MRVKMHWGSGTWQGQTMRKASVPENRRRKPAGKQDLPGRTSIIRCPTTECPYLSTQTGICRERETSPARLGPRYACLNEGEVYDRLIGEDDFGRFANSFLIIASKDGRQEKTIFAKYNRTRKEEFRIRTTMGDLDGERRVEKAALESAGRYHIF